MQWVLPQRGILPNTGVTGPQLQAEGDDATHGDKGWARCQVSGVPERVPKPSKLSKVPRPHALRTSKPKGRGAQD